MTIKERIIDYLMLHPEGIDDDKLTTELRLSHRQQANSICRHLENMGLMERKYMNGKIHNFWRSKEKISFVSQLEIGGKKLEGYETRNWFWEGNIQLKVVDYLVENGYKIKSIADTAKRQRGKDIIAEKNGEELWITAKGYPEGTEKTRASTQAGHWFKQAVFDIIEYHEQNNDVLLGVALPDFHRYHSLSEKIKWFKKVTNIKYYWVNETGNVSIE